MVKWDSLLTTTRNQELFKAFAFDKGVSLKSLRGHFTKGTKEQVEINKLLKGSGGRARKMAQMALNRRRNKGVLTY